MKAALLVPYFGKFPEYFQLVLDSCSYNYQHYEWIFITDIDDVYNFPSNCHIVRMSFNELRKKIQKLFDFKIILKNPYKLCDYRPAYGYIFSELLKDYDFWGHCDIDCIFGDIDKFINLSQQKNDRILRLGHLCLYKNTEENNKRFMLPINGIYRYREVFSTESNCIFDEHNSSANISIDTIWEYYGFSQYLNDNCVANIYYKSNRFKLLYQVDQAVYRKESKKQSIFYFSNGMLQRYYLDSGELKIQEFAYIHLMKRKMTMKFYHENFYQYKILPNKFEGISSKPSNNYEFKKEKKFYITNQCLISRYNNLKIKIRKLFK